MSAVDTIRAALFGNPPSADFKPSREGVLDAFSQLQTAVNTLSFGAVSVVKDTRAHLDADLAHAADTVALVHSDATDANNDFYIKVGASGSGSWTLTNTLHAAIDALASPYTNQLSSITPLMASRVVGPITVDATGTAFSNTAFYGWASSVKSYIQVITQLDVSISEANSTLQVIVAKVETDGTLTLVSSQDFAFVSTGVKSVATEILVPANHVAGIRFQGGGGYYKGGTIPGGELSWFIAAGPPASHTAKTIVDGNGIEFKLTLDGEIAGKARVAYSAITALRALIGSRTDVGWSNIVATGSVVPSNFTVIPETKAPQNGSVVAASIGTSGGGAAKIIVVDVNSSGVATVISSLDVTLVAGVNNLTLNIPIAAGQYVGIIGGNYMYQSGANPTGGRAYVKNGTLVTGDSPIDSTANRYEVEFTIASGLAASGGGIGGGDSAGLALLASADATGVTDATDLLQAARSQHPFPYVPAGKFKVTTVPGTGGGLWGPGQIIANGVQFVIPSAPMRGNLFDALRAALAEHIDENDVIGLVADSIGHFAYAPTGAEHFFNRFTDFANYGIARDEPIMTALRPSGVYDPSFYGLTYTGTVTTGTAGPLHESAILASGAKCSFVGTYETLGLFFERLGGAGSIVVKRGSTTLATISASGATDHDRYTGAIATGSTAQETYSFEASGGPVEITGLVRLGVKVANSRKRLLSGRFAHGSYTFNNFDATAIASIVKQATYAGGKLVPIIALGINDSFNTAPSAIATAQQAVIDGFQAAGINTIFGIVPSRPSATWDSTYASGRDYDSARAAIRKTYRGENIPMIGVDAADWSGEGDNQDGLHPNGSGQLRYNQDLVEGIASFAVKGV